MKYCIVIKLLFVSLLLKAQIWQWTEVAPMPEPVSNNAVVEATVNGVPYVYSFAGIDTTKIWSGIHLRSFRYNTQADVWESIAPLPDPNGGKIAAGASVVKNKIYIIGGYHVQSNGGEISSSKIHIYDPETNSYLADGADIPVPIDDHVQAVWKDSLIFVVTGWSNTGNVTNVQIYNPAEDEWMAGTSVPGGSDYRVFGGSGSIIGDTIYYSGGAKYGANFPASYHFRKGYINPSNPTEITWKGFPNVVSALGYRQGANIFEGQPIWIGGSDITYNYNGIAYNGSGGVAALSKAVTYNPATGEMLRKDGELPEVMDLRGLAKVGWNEFIIAGGMGQGQQVWNKTFLLTATPNPVSVSEPKQKIEVFPNPTINKLFINYNKNFNYIIFNIQGKKMLKGEGKGEIEIHTSNLSAGTYFIQILAGQKRHYQKLVIAPSF